MNGKLKIIVNQVDVHFLWGDANYGSLIILFYWFSVLGLLDFWTHGFSETRFEFDSSSDFQTTITQFNE